ncbi:hypothetical protein BGX20_009799 [Mortierella sp. AD010]|nr:hypothetical protein BGX20_009799 [Mortierella sp. AD010]
MSTKPCIAKGQRECVGGFHRDQCFKCTKGSITCNMCNSDSPVPSPCIYCFNGRRECSDCFGLGLVQRICRPCIEDHYRRQSRNTVKKVKSQLALAQNQFSRSMVSITNVIAPSSPKQGPSLHKSNHHSDTDVSKISISISSKLEKFSSKLAGKGLDTSVYDSTDSTESIGDKTRRRKWSRSSSPSNTLSSMVAA